MIFQKDNDLPPNSKRPLIKVQPTNDNAPMARNKPAITKTFAVPVCIKEIQLYLYSLKRPFNEEIVIYYYNLQYTFFSLF